MLSGLAPRSRIAEHLRVSAHRSFDGQAGEGPWLLGFPRAQIILKLLSQIIFKMTPLSARAREDGAEPGSLEILVSSLALGEARCRMYERQAVIRGVNRYGGAQDKLRSLTACVRDARAMRNALLTARLFAKDEITLLTDPCDPALSEEEASHDRFLDVLLPIYERREPLEIPARLLLWPRCLASAPGVAPASSRPR
jgi:hypothetical protein